MRTLEELIDFLTLKMSMTEMYQPVIIRYLLEKEGVASKAELANVLSAYDESVQDYYQKILMRWPKITLTKHEVVSYDKNEKLFSLLFDLTDEARVVEAKEICEQKIAAWIEKKAAQEGDSGQLASKRYRVLKAARGQCELCGVSSKLSPIDIDHIVPQSKANKHRQIRKDDVWMHVDDERNLQALCFRCNRAKRDSDATDFRLPSQKLVRDLIPQIILQEGRQPVTENITGKRLKEALFAKLVEEHVELLADESIEELVDLIEVAFAIAKTLGHSEEETLELMKKKRKAKGAFDEGVYLKGIH